MASQGGWCWRFWEHGGETGAQPFWCHHQDCREAEPRWRQRQAERQEQIDRWVGRQLADPSE